MKIVATTGARTRRNPRQPEPADNGTAGVVRSLAEWVPEAVEAVVRACDPREIVLFGSVARGDARPDSDIDLLVVIDNEADWIGAWSAALSAVARLVPEVDIIVSPQDQFEVNRAQVGTIVRPAVREGRVVYTRAA